MSKRRPDLREIFAAGEKWGCGIRPLFWLYCRIYRGVVDREISLAGIRPGEHVLQVGCGAIPFTAIHLALRAGARVTAIDNDPVAAGRARRALQRFLPGAAVRVVAGDGTGTLPPGFSAAIVSLQVREKETVLENLERQALPGARFVFRQPIPAHAPAYGPLPAGRTPAASTPQSMRTFRDSCLYRTGTPAEGRLGRS